jgi:hypothetical protein
VKKKGREVEVGGQGAVAVQKDVRHLLNGCFRLDASANQSTRLSWLPDFTCHDSCDLWTHLPASLEYYVTSLEYNVITDL